MQREITQGRTRIMVWWFSPLFLFIIFFCFLCGIVFMSGRIHRVVIIIILSFSPLFDFVFLGNDVLRGISCRGEYTGEEIKIILSFSPYEPDPF